MQYDQSNFLRYFLKQYHQVTVFSCENEPKLCNSQCFLLRLKTVFSD